MAHSGPFKGRFKIGTIEKGSLLNVVSTYGFSMVIGDDSDLPFLKRTLEIYPFDLGILLRPFSSSEMKEGFYFSVKGTRLGAFIERAPGPPDDGGAPPFVRQITAFKLHARYTPQALRVEIACSGHGVNGHVQPQGSAPFEAHVWFVVPRSELVSFLDVKAHNILYFESMFDECQ